MRLNKQYINQKRKEKGYKGKPGSKLNKAISMRRLRDKLNMDKIVRTRDPKWLKERIEELKKQHDEKQVKKKMRSYKKLKARYSE